MTSTLLALSLELVVLLLAAVGWLGYSALRQNKQRRAALASLLKSITQNESKRLSELDTKLQALGADEAKSNLAARKLILEEKKFFQALIMAVLDRDGKSLGAIHTPAQVLVNQCLEQIQTAQPVPGPAESTAQQPDMPVADETASADPSDEIEVAMDDDGDESTSTATEDDNMGGQTTPGTAASALSDEIEVAMDIDDDDISAATSPLNEDIEVTMDEDETDSQAEPVATPDDTPSLRDDDIEVTMDDDDESEPELPTDTEPTSLMSDDIEVTMDDDDESEPEPPADTESTSLMSDDIEVTMDTDEEEADIPQDQTHDIPPSSALGEIEVTMDDDDEQENPAAPEAASATDLSSDDIEVMMDDEAESEPATPPSAKTPASNSNSKQDMIDDILNRPAETEATDDLLDSAPKDTPADTTESLDQTKSDETELTDNEVPLAQSPVPESEKNALTNIQQAVEEIAQPAPASIIKTKDRLDELDDLGWLDELENDVDSAEDAPTPAAAKTPDQIDAAAPSSKPSKPKQN